MRRVFYLVVGCWVLLIRAWRRIKPRPFRVTFIRGRCYVCNRRLRAALEPQNMLIRAYGVVSICKRCSTKFQPRSV